MDDFNQFLEANKKLFSQPIIMSFFKDEYHVFCNRKVHNSAIKNT
ncbi:MULTISPECIES: hypothetical protein [Allobacillus]|nr:hypothetical protein [Allobacillus salarius]